MHATPGAGDAHLSKDIQELVTIDVDQVVACEPGP